MAETLLALGLANGLTATTQLGELTKLFKAQGDELQSLNGGVPEFETHAKRLANGCKEVENTLKQVAQTGLVYIRRFKLLFKLLKAKLKKTTTTEEVIKKHVERIATSAGFADVKKMGDELLKKLKDLGDNLATFDEKLTSKSRAIEEARKPANLWHYLASFFCSAAVGSAATAGVLAAEGAIVGAAGTFCGVMGLMPLVGIFSGIVVGCALVAVSIQYGLSKYTQYLTEETATKVRKLAATGEDIKTEIIRLKNLTKTEVTTPAGEVDELVAILRSADRDDIDEMSEHVEITVQSLEDALLRVENGLSPLQQAVKPAGVRQAVVAAGVAAAGFAAGALLEARARGTLQAAAFDAGRR